MNQLLQTFLIFVIGLIGGLIGSALIGGADTTQEAENLSELGVTVEGEADLADRMEAMQASLGSLTRRLELQESTLLTLQDRVAGAIEMDRSLRDGRLPGGQEFAMVPGGMGDVPTGQSFDAAVDAVIQQREEEEAAERSERREERRQEQLEQRVNDLAEQLGLDATQKDAFADALNTTSVARNDFFVDMRENGFSGREAIQERMAEIRDQELETLGSVLNQDQLTQYQGLTESSGFGGWGRGGGGGQSGTGNRDRGGF
ncbi:MAG: hypothetical protein ACYTEP_09595 [Planctomycetota bacterium]|jgi:hypothetical protein